MSQCVFLFWFESLWQHFFFLKSLQYFFLCSNDLISKLHNTFPFVHQLGTFAVLFFYFSASIPPQPSQLSSPFPLIQFTPHKYPSVVRRVSKSRPLPGENANAAGAPKVLSDSVRGPPLAIGERRWHTGCTRGGPQIIVNFKWSWRTPNFVRHGRTGVHVAADVNWNIMRLRITNTLGLQSTRGSRFLAEDPGG